VPSLQNPHPLLPIKPAELLLFYPGTDKVKLFHKFTAFPGLGQPPPGGARRSLAFSLRTGGNTEFRGGVTRQMLSAFDHVGRNHASRHRALLDSLARMVDLQPSPLSCGKRPTDDGPDNGE
jgi:hypothetical protein